MPKDAFDILVVSGGNPSSIPANSFLVGANVWYTNEDKYREIYICGLELRYSNEREGLLWNAKSAHCGKVAGANRCDDIAMSFRQDEHIIGVEFDVIEDYELTNLTFYTTDPRGRHFHFFVDSEGLESYNDYGEFRGVNEYDDDGTELGRCPYTSRSEKMVFTCKRGNRVTGMRFKDGMVVSISQKPIPAGQDGKWWEKSYAYTPPEKPICRIRKSIPTETWNDATEARGNPSSIPANSFLTGVDICYTSEDKYREIYICGVELRYSNEKEGLLRDAKSAYCGKVAGANKCDTMNFRQGEHIIGIEFDVTEDEELTNLTFYTTDPRGRHFHFFVESDGIEYFNDYGEFRGVNEYDIDGTELGRCPYTSRSERMVFTCKQGNRVTGMRFKDGMIVSISQKPIPAGQGGKWWEKSYAYTPAEKPGCMAHRSVHTETWNDPKSKKSKKSKKKEPKLLTEEQKEQKKQRLINHVQQWSTGDKEIVERAKTAANQNYWNFHCSVPGCRGRFPSEEVLELHVQNTKGKAHKRHRSNGGLLQTDTTDDMLTSFA